MKYLVIGGSGFIGRNILRAARSSGRVAFGTRAQSFDPCLLPFNLETDRIVEVAGHDVFTGSGTICVIICAVVSNMDRCLTERNRSYRINVTGTIRLIEDCVSYGAKVVFLSTCFVFDGTRGYYREEDPPSPVNEYARQKVEVENYLARRSESALIVRLEKIVSDHPDDGQMLSQWQSLLRRQQPITCIQGSLLSPTYVGDIAVALFQACDQDLRGTYHVTNSEFFYRDELARQFCYSMGEAPNVVTRPLAAFGFADRRALKSYLDGSKFVQATGFRFTPMSRVFRSFRERLTSGP